MLLSFTCTLAAALAPGRFAASARGRLVSNPQMAAVQVIDLFPDPPSVGGNQVVAPSTSFPSLLDAPDAFKPAIVTPFPDFASVVFGELGATDLAAAAILGIALYLGPDFLLAPAGLVRACVRARVWRHSPGPSPSTHRSLRHRCLTRASGQAAACRAPSAAWWTVRHSGS